MYEIQSWQHLTPEMKGTHNSEIDLIDFFFSSSRDKTDKYILINHFLINSICDTDAYSHQHVIFTTALLLICNH